MSCRILGRNIEESILLYIKKIAKDRNSQKLIGRLNPTKKNKLVIDFYTKSGFLPTIESTNFEYNLMTNQLGSYPDHLTVHEREIQK